MKTLQKYILSLLMIVSTVSMCAMDDREYQTSSLNSIAIKQIVAEELEQISTKQNKELHKKKIVPVLQQLERRAPLKASKKLNLQSDILSVGLLKNEILEYLGGPHVKASLVFSGDRGLVPWIIVKQRDAMVKSIKSGDFEGLKKAYGLLDAYTSLFISPKAPKSSDFIKNYCRLENSQTLLWDSAWNGKVEVVRLLLDLGANLNTVGSCGKALLHISAWNGKVEVVRLLLDRGANINVLNNYGWTPLYISTKNGKVEVARLLLDRGANVDTPDENGQTPLYVSAENGNVELVRLFLDCGANVETADYYGRTPLYISVRNREVEVVRLLLDRGANIDTADNYGRTLNQITSNQEIKALIAQARMDRALSRIREQITCAIM